MKNWIVFVIAIGFLLIASSPRLPSPLMYLVIGLVMVIAGFVKLIKSNRK